MKSTIIKFITLAILLLLVDGLAGCDAEDDTIIVPKGNISVDIASFFKEELPYMEKSNGFFVNSESDEVFLVNSQEDFKRVYHGSRNLPTINFNYSTLIIGQCLMTERWLCDKTTDH